MYGIVVSESARIAGDRMDDAIIAYAKRRHNLLVGERTAEEVKIGIGSAIPLEDELTMAVRGRDQVSGLPRTITLTTNEITQALQDSLRSIVQTVRSVLERTPPELAADVIDRGLVLAGGGALLRHLDVLLTQETGIPCHLADNPLECTAIGTGVALEYWDVIRRSQPTEEEALVASA
jgi:rod shape-determining protein MreB